MAKSDHPEPSAGLAARFQAAWESDPSPPEVFDFLASHPERTAMELLAVIRVDQRFRWLRGKPLSLRVYLGHFPVIAARSDLVRLLVEGDRAGRHEANWPADDSREDPREAHPSHAATHVIVRPDELYRTVSDDQEAGPGFLLPGPEGAAPPVPSTTHDANLATTEDRLEFDFETSPAASSAKTPHTLEAGRGSRFILLRKLGAGGMGVVFEAYDELRGELVALKTMKRVDPTALVRFKQEFRSLADISHPNLVNLYQLFSSQDRWYFSMELIDGRDFLSYIRCAPDSVEATGPTVTGHDPRCEPLYDEGRLREGLAQLVEGVHALHSVGMLHRDIKPTNVLVTRAGRVVLLDFGLTANLERDPAAPEGAAERQIVGTAAHMSPEQAVGEPLTAASDWYSVGVILYTALSGRLPFDGAFEEVMFRKRTCDPDPPETLVEGLPDDLSRLCMALLARVPQQRPGRLEILEMLGDRGRRPASLPVPGPRSSSPLVGRARHRKILEDAYESIAEGRPAAVFLSGRSGTGKTTLIRSFLDDLAARADTLVLAGRCHEREWVPFKAFDSLIDALARHLKRLPERELEVILPRDVALLARVFPVLRSVQSLTPAGNTASEMPDPQELRLRVFAALRELLTRLASEARLVLAVDDLHWGDADSASLLAELLYTANPPVMLVLGAYRLEDVDRSHFCRTLRRSRESGDSKTRTVELVVDSLTQAESRELALALLKRDDALARAQAHLIARESAGNPLFIDELVKHVREGSCAEGWDADARIDLESVLRSRIESLAPGDQRLLEIVCVSGRPIDQSLAFRAAELGTGGRAALGSLRSARLVRGSSSDEHERIEVYHDRIRETVLEHLPDESLRWYHERLSRLLEAEPQADPETLADHLRAAGETARASVFYARTADTAAHALAFDQAARLYRLALELHRGSDADRRAIARKLGDALANGGRGAEAAEAYLGAAERTTAAETLDLQRLASSQLLTSGHVDEGLALLKSILGPLGLSVPSTPPATLVALLRNRVWIRLRGYRFRARDESQVAAEDLSRIDVCWSAAAGLSVIDPLLGAYFQARGLLLALRAGEPSRVVRSLAMEAAHLSTAGNPSAARVASMLGKAEELARGLNSSRAWGMISMVRGTSALMLGRWSPSRADLDQAEAIFRNRCTGVAWERDTASGFALWALLHLGRIDELKERWSGLIREARERGDLYAATTLTTFFLAIIRLAGDAPEGVEDELEAVMRRWSTRGFSIQHASVFRSLMEVDLYLGRADAAWERVRATWPEYTRSMLLRIQFIRIQMLELRGRSALAVAEQEGPRRIALLSAQQDAGRLEREGQAWATAHAHYIRAGIAACHEDATRAIHHLQLASTRYDAADMPLHGRVMQYRLGEILGGEEGRKQIAEAVAWMRSKSIARPERWVATYAPGFSMVASSHIATSF